MTFAVLGAAAVAAFVLAATAQAVTGFGFALVAVPLLLLVTDSVTAVVGTTVVGLLLTGAVGVRERAHVERAPAVRFIGAGLLGMPIGLVALVGMDEESLTVLVAVGVLGCAGLLWTGARLPAGRGPQWAAGVLSGAMLTSTGMNGPPVVLSMHGLALPPRRFRATLQVVFFGQDAAAVFAFAVLGSLDPAVATVVAAGVLGVPGGWWLGNTLFRRLPADGFRRVVLTAVTASAAVAIATALV